jgi:S-adenosylmethionine-diacylglycerol 3-amino-3-carboxypropyl transferase
MADTDIAARASFDQIRYAQVWEDADILVDALRLKPSDTVVSIASAGDNAFALLAEGVERVIAVDLNPAQLACVRLRVSMYRTMGHAEFLELMGSRPSSRRAALLTQAVAGLSEQDQAYWAGLRADVIRYGVGGVGKFERYFRIFRRYVLPFIHNDQTVDAVLRPQDPAARRTFYDQRWNVWGWRMMLKGFFSRAVMGRLGRDPAFFDHVEGSPSDQVARLTRKALVDQDPSANPYLHWILKGAHGEALPRALRAPQFEAIRTRLDRIEARLCTVETLAEEGVKADAFNLSDIFEYMSAEAHEAAYGTILAASRPGARIAYWNMMAPRRAPAALVGRVKTNEGLEAELKPQDKAFFYRDFVVEDVL